MKNTSDLWDEAYDLLICRSPELLTRQWLKRYVPNGDECLFSMLQRMIFEAYIKGEPAARTRMNIWLKIDAFQRAQVKSSAGA